MTPEIRTYRVPDRNLAELQARIEKLNKRAAKLHCTPIALTILRHEDVAETEISPITGRREPTGRVRRFHFLTITGEAPRVNGWTCIGKLQYVKGNGDNEAINILKAAPGHDIPEVYRNASPENCDHCHKRIQRNDTFILASESEPVAYKQVGRNCLADFLRTQNGEGYAAAAEILFSAGDFCGMAEDGDFDPDHRGRRGHEMYALDWFLEHVSAAIRINGWMARKNAQLAGNRQATVDDVVAWTMTNAGRDKPFCDWTVEESDKERAAATIEWLHSLQARPELNDYLYNLSTIGQLDAIDSRMFGLAASAVAAYSREMEREIERRKRAEFNKDSNFFGTIGKREVFTLTLEWERELQNDFGVSILYKFRDQNGNVACWFASKPFAIASKNPDIRVEPFGHVVELGETVTVKATVKRHEERDGVKQTLLNRVAEFVPKGRKAA